jgi:signal transduction histidine kinase
MPKRPSIRSSSLDALVAAVLSAGAVVALVASHDLAKTPGSICVIAFCALAAFRRRQPVPIAILAGAVYAVTAVPGSLDAVNDTFVSTGIALAMFSYTIGSKPPLRWSLPGLAALVVGVEVTSGASFNPLPGIVAIGAFVAGSLIGSRQRAAALMRARAAELEDEEELFVTESVRRERMRIAHELHDIVAHCISLTVVQAEAGQRLAAIDVDGAAEALRFIADAARQAGDDIDRLSAFLADPGSERAGAGMALIENLVERVRASGTRVRCRLAGDLEELTEQECQLMYRVVQEALTNAVKHAPGAEVEVAASASGHTLELSVENGAATRRTSLASTGGGNGIVGMRQRIEAARGTLFTGPSAAGGWVVRMELPLNAPATLTEVR